MRTPMGTARNSSYALAAGMAVLLACLLLVPAGCGSAGAGSEFSFGALWRSVSKAASAGDGLVTVSAAGDVNFGDGVTPTLTSEGLSYPFSGVVEAFESTDLSFVNLECCISSQGSPVPGKEYCFEGPADSAGALAQGGIKVVSLANNHSKDYGTQAFADTLAHLKESGIAYCGAGNNATEAYSPAILEAHGAKVAFLAFTWVVPDGWPATSTTPGVATSYDRARLAGSIKEAKKNADFVVVSFHWGIELATSPNGDQRSLGHLAVDSGADLVLGHHPHVVQGLELYKNRLIAYSLGNFVFSPPREISSRSMMVLALLGRQGLVQARIVPAVIRNCRPVILSGAAADSWAGTIAGYCQALGTSVVVTDGRGYIRGQPPAGAPGAQQ